jgi:hypothetical protein
MLRYFVIKFGKHFGLPVVRATYLSTQVEGNLWLHTITSKLPGQLLGR